MWGSCKAVLVLATLQQHFTIVLAEAIDAEIRGGLARKKPVLTASGAYDVLKAYEGWLTHVRVESIPAPTLASIAHHRPHLLPVVQHTNDIPAVVSAIDAQPDWALSTNTDHWGPKLAGYSGLRIARPVDFLSHLSRGWP
jgi:hypothetical protein